MDSSSAACTCLWEPASKAELSRSDIQVARGEGVPLSVLALASHVCVSPCPVLRHGPHPGGFASKQIVALR